MTPAYTSIAMNRQYEKHHEAPTHHLSSKSTQEAPLWFHGLLAREAAEDLLLKSPNSKPGLYLVRQSSNRGGRFVISVCTGEHVNHYLIETLESMFYVKRDSSQDRGQDIQARDLNHLLNCYTLNPLDSSGLKLGESLKRTTPVKTSVSLTAKSDSKKNHNYIPLYADEREVVTIQDFETDDLQMLPFGKGEILTLLHKESNRWWYAYNEKRQMGFIPAAFVRKLSESERGKMGYANPLYTDSDEKVAPITEAFRRLSLESSFHVSPEKGHILTPSTASDLDLTAEELQLEFYREKFAKDDIYVSSDYITSFLRATEHIKLAKMQRSHERKVANQNAGASPLLSRHTQSSHHEKSTPPSIRRDLKPRIHKPLPPTPEDSPVRTRKPLPVQPVDSYANNDGIETEGGYSFLAECSSGSTN
ncbi:uncharacterized protein LOC100369652 [Saccoglossus kowalevskii]|uniref:Uncharacterized protein LOC100369652 n=1 Tax=Saccoglossus kowalevskii TaxID=10224 RepID=A0ABM0LZP0_SACKO|nr:PREDICTED: uncharacterized protein LOC100369652 [Saccoglossus kowalevskii]